MSLKDKIEANPFWYLATFIVASFVAGFAAYAAIMYAAGMDRIATGTYVLRDEVERGYVRKDRLNEQFMPKRQIELEFIPRKDLGTTYVDKAECRKQIEAALKEKSEVVEQEKVTRSEESNRQVPDVSGSVKPNVPARYEQTLHQKVEPARPATVPARKLDEGLSVKDGIYLFEASDCLKTGDQVNCGVVVTNSGDRDSELEFSQTSMVDTSGNEASGASAVFPSGRFNYASHDLPPNVPVKFSVKGDFSPDGEVLTVVLYYRSRIGFEYTRSRIVLRGLPIRR